jgi:hypothetical protein
MEVEMAGFDIVDVLREQHDQIHQLCAGVERDGGAHKQRLFAELDRQVNLHELGDRRVVHPATRNTTAAGDRVGLACMIEEGNIERTLADLKDIGVGHATFDRRFAALHQAILAHNGHEERDEFPLIRLYVRAERLHTMASELHDVQVMGVS